MQAFLHSWISPDPMDNFYEMFIYHDSYTEHLSPKQTDQIIALSTNQKLIYLLIVLNTINASNFCHYI